MGIEVFDIRNEKELKRFRSERHIANVRSQVGKLADRPVKDWMVQPLFESGSATRYIIWEDGELSGVVEQLDYLSNGNGWQLYNRQNGSPLKGKEIHTFYNMVFCYGSNADVVLEAFDQAMVLTDGKLLMALDPKDENSCLWIAGGNYTHSDGSWQVQSSTEDSAKAVHNLTEIVELERPILAGKEAMANEMLHKQTQMKFRTLYDMLTTKVAADRGLFYA